VTAARWCSNRRAAGGNLTLGQARYAFTKAVTAVGGIDGVRLHDLRHTCASLAISAGANVKVVQKLLGHNGGADAGQIRALVPRRSGRRGNGFRRRR
jgi:integrase